MRSGVPHKGRKVIYPITFGKITAGFEKDYPVDFSHFNIQGTAVGTVGVEADPDKATFPVVDTTTPLGADRSIKLDSPVFARVVGSTDIARINWVFERNVKNLSLSLIDVPKPIC